MIWSVLALVLLAAVSAVLFFLYTNRPQEGRTVPPPTLSGAMERARKRLHLEPDQLFPAGLLAGAIALALVAILFWLFGAAALVVLALVAVVALALTRRDQLSRRLTPRPAPPPLPPRRSPPSRPSPPPRPRFLLDVDLSSPAVRWVLVGAGALVLAVLVLWLLGLWVLLALALTAAVGLGVWLSSRAEGSGGSVLERLRASWNRLWPPPQHRAPPARSRPWPTTSASPRSDGSTSRTRAQTFRRSWAQLRGDLTTTEEPPTLPPPPSGPARPWASRPAPPPDTTAPAAPAPPAASTAPAEPAPPPPRTAPAEPPPPPPPSRPWTPRTSSTGPTWRGWSPPPRPSPPSRPYQPPAPSPPPRPGPGSQPGHVWDSSSREGSDSAPPFGRVTPKPWEPQPSVSTADLLGPALKWSLGVAGALAVAVVLWLVEPWMLVVLALVAGAASTAFLLKRSASDSRSPFSSLLDSRGWQELRDVPGRFQGIPPGCLMSVLVATAVWIVVWLVVLVVGLRVLLGG